MCFTWCVLKAISLFEKERAEAFFAWASYQIRKIAGCACAGNAGNVFSCRRFLRKPLVSDPGMHHGTCVTHVPWCMSGSLTCGDRENVPGIPGACAPAIYVSGKRPMECRNISTPRTRLTMHPQNKHKACLYEFSWAHRRFYLYMYISYFVLYYTNLWLGVPRLKLSPSLRSPHGSVPFLDMFVTGWKME